MPSKSLLNYQDYGIIIIIIISIIIIIKMQTCLSESIIFVLKHNPLLKKFCLPIWDYIENILMFALASNDGD